MALASEESRVLLIYTGGTIGMLVSDAGYVPEPFFLFETLRSQTSRFHDPLGDSLLSKSRSVEAFRAWSSSRDQSRTRGDKNTNERKTSPLRMTSEPRNEKETPTPPSPISPEDATQSSTLLVRSTRPLQAPPLAGLDGARGGQFMNERPERCKKVRENCYEMHLPSLITPAATAETAPGLQGQGVKRIRYAILEWNPLLDSSNMEISDWIRIAQEIELNYSLFDAFVVLHGTDTMCYSSSALSFLLEDLGKTVILTGAQIPLSQLRNDAVENLLGALSIAGQFLIPECSLFFNHTLYRGNRVSKSSSFDFDAFSSPNFPPLAQIGIDIVVNWSDVVRPTSLRPFKAHKNMCPNVATLRLFPGITAATVRAFLAPPVQGIVLETFGAGNAPQRPDLVEALKEACERGVVIVAISQCAKGSVSVAYETGRALQAIGVASGGDMTTECALAKLSYLLSKLGSLSAAEVHALMQTPLRGELTLPPSHVLQAPPQTQPPEPSDSHDALSSLLKQITKLSAPPSTPIPTVHVSTPAQTEERGRPSLRGTQTPSMTLLGPTVALSKSARETTSPWANTLSETASTEAALFPFLVHLAVGKDDVESLKYCLGAAIGSSSLYASTSPTTETFMSSPLSAIGSEHVPTSSIRALITGGVENCLDPTSGRTPLHVAALNGSVKCAQLLLESGALVHIRDLLDHTALYYAARGCHEAIVDSLVQAGAHFGGADVEGGFVRLAMRKAHANGDPTALRVWSKAGAESQV